MQTGSVFALPYRMLFAVVTMDTVAIYDTQQATPLCLLTKLHYDEFTDMTWYVLAFNPSTALIDHRYLRSPDGQCLILSSRDGYCTLIIFDDILPAYHTQQHTMQLQSIAHHHSVPISYGPNSHPSSSSSQVTPAATPSATNVSLPHSAQSQSQASQSNPKKRSDPPLTPAASVDGSEAYFSSSHVVPEQNTQGNNEPKAGPSTGEIPAAASDTDKVQEPPKKKRRVALTRVGDLES